MTIVSYVIVELSIAQCWIDTNELCLRHSVLKYYNSLAQFFDRVAQPRA